MFEAITTGLIHSLVITLSMMVAIFIPIFVLGPSVETRFFPAVEDLRLQEITSEVYPEGYRYFVALFEKKRACSFIPERTALLTLNGEVWQRIFIAPLNIISLQPTGPIISEVWKIDTLRLPTSQMKLVIYHRCHSLWVSETVHDFSLRPSELEVE